MSEETPQERGTHCHTDNRSCETADTRRFISGIKNLNLNNLNYQLFKFYMESTRGYLNFSLVLSSCYIKSICSHLNLTHRPYTINAIFVLLLFKIAISASCLLRRLYKIYMV